MLGCHSTSPAACWAARALGAPSHQQRPGCRPRTRTSCVARPSTACSRLALLARACAAKLQRHALAQRSPARASGAAMCVRSYGRGPVMGACRLFSGGMRAAKGAQMRACKRRARVEVGSTGSAEARRSRRPSARCRLGRLALPAWPAARKAGRQRAGSRAGQHRRAETGFHQRRPAAQADRRKGAAAGPFCRFSGLRDRRQQATIAVCYPRALTTAALPASSACPAALAFRRPITPGSTFARRQLCAMAMASQQR
jgi:hypothetical protein